MNPAPRYVARLVCQSQYHVILSLFTTDSSTGVTDTSGLAPVVHDASLIVAALMMKHDVAVILFTQVFYCE